MSTQNTIKCTIKEEKIHVKIQGGGVIENFTQLITLYKIMLKTVYDVDEDGIVDYAEAIKSGSNVLTYLAIKNSIDLAHSHNNKSLLDSITYVSEYHAYTIES